MLGLVGACRANQGRAGGRGLAVTDAVLGVLGILVSVAVIAIGAAFWSSDTVQDLRACVDQAQSQAEADACSREFEDQLEN